MIDAAVKSPTHRTAVVTARALFNHEPFCLIQNDGIHVDYT